MASNTKKVNELVNKARENVTNAQQEIKVYTLNLLEQHWYDNLSNLVENATNRGFVAAEWIDFWGVGSVDPQTTISWAYDVIKNQGLNDIIEPYYNNVSHRLGIVLNRSVLESQGMLSQGAFLTLPLEIQKDNATT
jgi:hypothetical protein